MPQKILQITQILNAKTTVQKVLESGYSLKVITCDENVINIYQ